MSDSGGDRSIFAVNFVFLRRRYLLEHFILRSNHACNDKSLKHRTMTFSYRHYHRVPHFCNKDTVIKGYTIPAGTTVLSNLDAVLLSDKTWDQPLEFRPDRFLYNDGNLIHPEEFIPFSIGKVNPLSGSHFYIFMPSIFDDLNLKNFKISGCMILYIKKKKKLKPEKT